GRHHGNALDEVSTIARGTFVNLGARLAAIALGVSITVLTARMGTTAQGQFALLTSVETLLLALFSGFGVALARRVSYGGERPRPILGATGWACLALGIACAVVLAGPGPHGSDRPGHCRGSAADVGLLRRLLVCRSVSDSGQGRGDAPVVGSG